MIALDALQLRTIAADVLRVLHRVKGPLVGADVVELLPSADQGGRTAVAAAKLVKELAGLMLGGTGP